MSLPSPKSVWLQDLTWQEVEEYPKHDRVARSLKETNEHHAGELEIGKRG